MTNEIATLVTLFLALGVVLWQSHCLKANARGFFASRDRMREEHMAELAEARASSAFSLLKFAESYVKVLRWRRAWKKTAKKYRKLYKETVNE